MKKFLFFMATGLMLSSCAVQTIPYSLMFMGDHSYVLQVVLDADISGDKNIETALALEKEMKVLCGPTREYLIQKMVITSHKNIPYLTAAFTCTKL